MFKNLLIIGFVWPEPKSSAAGSRMLQLIAEFQRQGYSITFSSTANMTQNVFDLGSIDVKSAAIELNNSSFDDFIKELNPGIVLFDRFMTEEQFGWRVAEQCPDAIRILDTEDLHGLRKAREVALKNNELCSRHHLQNDVTKREIASIYRCDLSLIISEVELGILTSEFKIDSALLHYLPFLVDPVSKAETQGLPTFEERQHFITIGNFLHGPNYDAIVYLKQMIWPLIRKKLPNVELHIYGAYESQKITQLHHKNNGFLIKGFAEDANEVMQYARVCLAPLRFGAGLKGKLIAAMLNGTPCVMSGIAAEGMFGDLEGNGFINDSPGAFAQKAVVLYSNEYLWKAKQQNGFHVVEKRFSKSLFEVNFQSKIEDLFKNLKDYRQKNFTGQLLMHHTLQSTKYMSKWIEAKNK